MTHRYVLTLRCQDRPGIVAGVTTLLFSQGGNILEAQQFDDAETNGFFMRVVFAMEDSTESGGEAGFRRGMAQIADDFKMEWRLRSEHARTKALIMVSQLDHCLLDLLYHVRSRELPMDVVAIASNHPRSAHPTLDEATPYHHFPITASTKPQQEAQVRQLIEETGAELVILARYMQILSDELNSYLAGRCINIHHSFLPAFKGAKPYHQAHHRGVKIIGATAHYVTADLDEGPIIAQDVERVTHNDSAQTLINKGREIERRVLTRAVALHLEDRVLLNGAKTVVFS